MRSLICLRVSTDEQAEAGNGLNAQLDACRAWCARDGREIVGPFLDDGVSGAAPLHKRTGLLEAMALLAEGDVLLFAKRDRLGRDPILIAMVEAAAARRKARVVSAAGEGTEGDDPSNVLMRRIVDAFAEYERLVIKARTKAALGAKARRGERVGTIPFGYDLVDDGRRSKQGHPLALVENPAELAIVATIRALSAAGLGPRGIARELARRGVATKAGLAAWSDSSVRRILAQPVNATATATGPVVSAHSASLSLSAPHLLLRNPSDAPHHDPEVSPLATADPDHVLG